MVEKPQKPYPEFPLFAHANGSWAKKISGKMTYFGPWSDWQAALRKYHAALDGPPASLKVAIGRYLAAQNRLQQAGEVSFRHYRTVEWTLDKLSAHIGPTKSIARLTSDDYGVWRAIIASTNGAVSLDNHIRCVRAFLNWCRREKIIAELPPGDSLKKPTLAQLRLARAARGSRMFKPQEIRQLLTCAGPQMRAMIFLALNAGLGNEDLAQLRTKHLAGVWLDYPRPKTGIERRVPLWPETREALAAVIRADDEVVFRTKYGNLWTPKGKGPGDSPISQRFTKLCKGADLYKPGRGFYSLRHVCQTVGEESGDHPAIEYILGHAPAAGDMSNTYRERMAKKRLFRVVKYIRHWLRPHKIDKRLWASA